MHALYTAKLYHQTVIYYSYSFPDDASPQAAMQSSANTSPSHLQPPSPTSISPASASPVKLSEAGRHSPLPQRAKFRKKFAAKPARSPVHQKTDEQIQKDVSATATQIEKKMTEESATVSEVTQKEKISKGEDVSAREEKGKKRVAKKKKDRRDRKLEEEARSTVGAAAKAEETTKKEKAVPKSKKKVTKSAHKESKPAPGKIPLMATATVQATKAEDREGGALIRKADSEEKTKQEDVVGEMDIDKAKKTAEESGAKVVASAVVNRAIEEGIRREEVGPVTKEKVVAVEVSSQQHSTSGVLLRQEHVQKKKKDKKKMKRRHKRSA